MKHSDTFSLSKCATPALANAAAVRVHAQVKDLERHRHKSQDDSEACSLGESEEESDEVVTRLSRSSSTEQHQRHPNVRKRRVFRLLWHELICGARIKRRAASGV